jgi:hypothetical protein
MVKFEEVAPEDVGDKFDTRGRVSYPLLRDFLATGMYSASPDLAGYDQKIERIASSCINYCRVHQLPVKVLQKGGRLVFYRLDYTPEGAPIPGWLEKRQRQREARVGGDIDIKPIAVAPVKTK